MSDASSVVGSSGSSGLRGKFPYLNVFLEVVGGRPFSKGFVQDYQDRQQTILMRRQFRANLKLLAIQIVFCLVLGVAFIFFAPVSVLEEMPIWLWCVMSPVSAIFLWLTTRDNQQIIWTLQSGAPVHSEADRLIRDVESQCRGRASCKASVLMHGKQPIEAFLLCQLSDHSEEVKTTFNLYVAHWWYKPDRVEGYYTPYAFTRKPPYEPDWDEE